MEGAANRWRNFPRPTSCGKGPVMAPASGAVASTIHCGCYAYFFLETKGIVSLPVRLDLNTFSNFKQGVSCRK